MSEALFLFQEQENIMDCTLWLVLLLFPGIMSLLPTDFKRRGNFM